MKQREGASPAERRVWGAVIVGAGRGRRFGDPLPKQFHDLGGRPVMAWALEAFLRCEGIATVVPVLHPDDFGLLSEWHAALDESLAAKLHAPIAGGARRQDSVLAGLAPLLDSADLVAVHDAARPFIDLASIERVFEQAQAEASSSGGGAILAVRSSDSIKLTTGLDSRRVASSFDRRLVWRAQTPQVFAPRALAEALNAMAPGDEATDEAQAIERAGGDVRLVEGIEANFKITTRDDLTRARAAMADRALRPK